MKTALALLLLTFARAQSFERLSGQNSEIKEKLTVVVASQEEWAKLWKAHNAYMPAPAVDFERQQVVAVFLGEQREGGTKVELTLMNDPLDKSKLVVFYKEVAPAKPARIQMIARPYEMRVVPRAYASVAFERDVKARALMDSLREFAKNPGFDRF